MNFITTVLMVANGYRAGLKKELWPEGEPTPELKFEPDDEIWEPYMQLRNALQDNHAVAFEYLKEIEKNLRLLASDNELRKTKLNRTPGDTPFNASAEALLKAIETYEQENSWRGIISGY
ncbi:MAG: hypothetical protein R3A44_18425 [Caldilineaceae bacterium]